MVFVGAAIMPHGALPFDGDSASDSPECRERYSKLSPNMAQKFSNLYNGMCKTGQVVADMDPDIIILHSPHGIVLDNSVGVYANPTASGDAGWNDRWTEFKVNLSLDLSKSEALVQHLRSDNIATEGIISFARLDAPLKWGEAIPAWYIQQHIRKDVKYIIMSPSRQPWPVTAVSDDRLQVGTSLRAFVDSLQERVAVVISGDLSHVYHSDCPDPLYQPAKGWDFHSDHMAACTMERSFLGWVKSLNDLSLVGESTPLPDTALPSWNPTDALPWLHKAVELQPTAYSCGMVGFIVLHAFLQGQYDNGVKVRSSVMACEAPTYYGMMAATFCIYK